MGGDDDDDDDDDGSRLIIMDCMAQYCNYWRKRKSPIGGNII